MRHAKSGAVWQSIIAKNPNWFSKKSLKYWNSKVYWATLTETPNGWRFISSEDNFNRTEILFTIRLATENGIETLGKFQEHKTLADARLAL